MTTGILDKAAPAVYHPHPLVAQLLQMRHGLGWTQQDIANLIGYSRATVASWESGFRTPPLPALEAYASVFGQAVMIGPPPLPDGHKRCTRCGAVKALEEFVKDRRMSQGRGSHCKDCNADASLAAYHRRRGQT